MTRVDPADRGRVDERGFDRRAIGRERGPDGSTDAAPEAERAPADPDERSVERVVAHDLGDRDELADRQDVRRARDRGRGRVAFGQVGQRDRDDLAGRESDDGVGDHAGRVRRQVDQVVEVELLAAANVEDREQVRRQPGKQRRDRGEGRTVVAALGVAAHEQADRSRSGDHDPSSTRRSRKWVAHEMHGS